MRVYNEWTEHSDGGGHMFCQKHQQFYWKGSPCPDCKAERRQKRENAAHKAKYRRLELANEVADFLAAKAGAEEN